MSMKTNKIKAPQPSLKSSWRDECFKKPKVGAMLISSKSNRPAAIGKAGGTFIGSNYKHSNEY